MPAYERWNYCDRLRVLSRRVARQKSVSLARIELGKNSKLGPGVRGRCTPLRFATEVEDACQASIGEAQVRCGIPPHPQPLSRVGERGAAFFDEFQFFHCSLRGEGTAVNRGFRDIMSTVTIFCDPQ